MAEVSELGRYELRRVLGKGAMGVVYEGFDPALSRRVAVKTILKSVALNSDVEREYSDRFLVEAKAVARLNHPNIVQVYDFGLERDVAYLVMEYIEGRELRSFFEAKENFSPSEVVRVIGELLDALDFAHGAGVIHRDVKPANVMLDAQRHVKLTDFGVARIQDSERSAAGTMVGTPAFMSPEQIKGAKIDRRTDIFSVGVVLYQALTGEQPFKAAGAWTVAKKIVEDDPPPPSSVALAISPAFDAVVQKALAKKPSERFASAKEFSAELRSVLTAAPQQEGSAGTRQRPKIETRASETELEFWRAIQNRDDLDELELYAEQFPNGAYTQLARLKIAKLREPLEAARRAQEDKARSESEARAKQEEQARALRQAEERAKHKTEERTRTESEARTQHRPAGTQSNSEATVAVGHPDSPPTRTAANRPAPKTSFVVLVIVGAVIAVGGAGTFFALNRASAPGPVAETPVKPAGPEVDREKIRRDLEERIRREYAEKAAAEKAQMEKTVAEKAAAERAAMEKVAAAKTVAEKQAAEKGAQKAIAERIAIEKVAAEKAASAKVAADKAVAEKAAAEKAAAAKAATEKEAAEKAAAEKMAAEKVIAEKITAEKSAADRVASEKAALAKASAEKSAAVAAQRVGTQSWSYRSYLGDGETTGVGYIVVRYEGEKALFRMEAPRLNPCMNRESEAKVSRTEATTMIVVVPDLRGCAQIRFVIKNDGSGGRREVLEGSDWIWDRRDRDLTPRR